MSLLGIDCDACGTPMESIHDKYGDWVEYCPTCDGGNAQPKYKDGIDFARAGRDEQVSALITKL